MVRLRLRSTLRRFGDMWIGAGRPRDIRVGLIDTETATPGDAPRRTHCNCLSARAQGYQFGVTYALKVMAVRKVVARGYRTQRRKSWFRERVKLLGSDLAVKRKKAGRSRI